MNRRPISLPYRPMCCQIVAQINHPQRQVRCLTTLQAACRSAILQFFAFLVLLAIYQATAGDIELSRVLMPGGDGSSLAATEEPVMTLFRRIPSWRDESELLAAFIARSNITAMHAWHEVWNHLTNYSQMVDYAVNAHRCVSQPRCAHTAAHASTFN